MRLDLGGQARARGVVLVHHAGEHARGAAAQRARRDPRALERLPRGLEQQTLLRIHRERLARRDAEEGGVELGCAVDEAALARVARPRVVRIRVVETLEIPAAVAREAAYAIAAC